MYVSGGNERRFDGAGTAGAVVLFEQIDGLQFSVLGKLQVLLAEAENRLPIRTRDDHVNRHRLRIGVKKRGLSGGILNGVGLSCCSGSNSR